MFIVLIMSGFSIYDYYDTSLYLYHFGITICIISFIIIIILSRHELAYRSSPNVFKGL